MLQFIILLTDGFRDKNSDQIMFVSTLEEVRRGVSYSIDIANSEQTTVYLWNMLKKPTLSAAERRVVVELFERYAKATLSFDAHIQHKSLLCPPLAAHNDNKQLQSDCCGHVNMLLAQHAMSQTDILAAEKYASKVDAQSQHYATAEMLLKKVCCLNDD